MTEIVKSSTYKNSIDNSIVNNNTWGTGIDWGTITYPSDHVYSQPTISTTTISTPSTYKADITVNDVIIQGQKLSEILEELNKRLLILSRNQSMEEKYPELKEAYETYEKILTSLLAMEAVTGDNNIE